MVTRLAARVLSSWTCLSIRLPKPPSFRFITTATSCRAAQHEETNSANVLPGLHSKFSLTAGALQPFSSSSTPFVIQSPIQRSSFVHRPFIPVRTLVRYSKLGKMKTVKSVAKRFRVTGSGKFKFWPPGNVHNLMSKSHDRKCRIRKPRYASKTQTKMLRKMLSGRYS